MKEPTLGINPSAAPSVTSSFQHQALVLVKHEGPPLWINPRAAPSVTLFFQHQALLLMKHEGAHTRDEPFSCSQCDFEFSTSSTIIDEA